MRYGSHSAAGHRSTLRFVDTIVKDREPVPSDADHVCIMSTCAKKMHHLTVLSHHYDVRCTRYTKTFGRPDNSGKVTKFIKAPLPHHRDYQNSDAKAYLQLKASEDYQLHDQC